MGRILIIAFFIKLILCTLNATALISDDSNIKVDSHWLQWRGGIKCGADENCDVPIEWDIKKNQNIKWIKKIDGTGHSSPLTDGKFVYITSTSENKMISRSQVFLVFINLLIILFLLRYLAAYYNKNTHHETDLAIYYSSFLLIFILSISLIVKFCKGYIYLSNSEFIYWYNSNMICICLALNYFLSKFNRFKLIRKLFNISIIVFPIISFSVLPIKSNLHVPSLKSLLIVLFLLISFIVNLYRYQISKKLIFRSEVNAKRSQLLPTNEKFVFRKQGLISFGLFILILFEGFLFSIKDGYNWNVFCYDINNGQIIWKNNDIHGPAWYMEHPDNSLASSTPVIFGDYIYSYFGNHGLICINKSNGHTQWINNKLFSQGGYGAGSTPIVFNNRLFLFHSNTKHSLISCIDCFSGRLTWQTVEDFDKSLILEMYRPPIIKRIKNREFVIFASNSLLRIIDIDSGIKVHSRNFEDLGSNGIVSSIISDNISDSIIYISGRFFTLAINLNRIENENFIFWRTKVLGSNVSSPALYKNCVFSISDNGFLNGLDRITGKVIYKNKFHGCFYSSLTVAGKCLYINSLDGITYVLGNSVRNEIVTLKTNNLGDRIFASPALSNCNLLIRGEENLFCIGK